MHNDHFHLGDALLACWGAGLWAWNHFVDAAASPRTIGMLTAALIALRIAYLIRHWKDRP